MRNIDSHYVFISDDSKSSALPISIYGKIIVLFFFICPLELYHIYTPKLEITYYLHKKLLDFIFVVSLETCLVDVSMDVEMSVSLSVSDVYPLF